MPFAFLDWHAAYPAPSCSNLPYMDRWCAQPSLRKTWTPRRVLRLAAPLSAFMTLRALSSAMLQARTGQQRTRTVSMWAADVYSSV